MRNTNLAGLDLNLLPALEALLRRRNVTRAAEDVGLSQPAMSRALQRLREALGDPLLVRVPGGLAPTARAQEIAAGLAEALDRVSEVYNAPRFAPAEMRRLFRIAASDAQATLLGPGILARVRAQAPGVDLRFEAYGPDLRERVDSGALDLVFATASTPLPPGAVSEPLADDRLTLAMREGHPSQRRAWTLQDYARHVHVTISIRGDDESEIDAALGRQGLQRRIVLRTPYFLTALAAVGGSDAVTTVSTAIARRFAPTFGLALVETPLSEIPLQVTLVGAAARSNDPALRWLKGLIKAAAVEVYGEAASRRA